MFIAILLVLRNAPFVEPLVMFFSILAAVIGSLTVDVIAFVRSREPYVNVALPGDPSPVPTSHRGFGVHGFCW